MPLRPRCRPALTALMIAMVASACEGLGTSSAEEPTPFPWEVTLGPGDVLPEAFPLSLGHYWPPGAPFSALTEGQELEIVQGIQGGVHLEVALELDLGAAYAEVELIDLLLVAQTSLEEGEPVAELRLSYLKAGNIGQGVFRTQTLAIIFERNQARHYEDRVARVSVQVNVDGQLSARALSFRLIDTRDETRSP